MQIGVPRELKSDTNRPAGLPPGISELIDAGKARWNGRVPALPTPIKLRGDGPLASDYVIAGRR